MIELDTIYNEDCLETMRRMPEGFVDLTVTSPPYDNMRAYKGYSFDFENVAKELYRVTKPGGVVVWVVADATVNGSETGTSFRQALYFMQCGFNLHDTMIWEKKNYVPLTHNRYEQCFEYMFVFSKGRPNTFNPVRVKCVYSGAPHSRRKSNKEDGSAFRNRDDYTVCKEDKIHKNIFEYGNANQRLDHPAIFPEPLAADHIRSWSNEGDVVYDCFLGSGTTAKMAAHLKRRFIGSEISSDYYDIALRRIKLEQQQLTLF